MNFKEKLMTVLETLGFTKKFQDKTLSKEEFNTLVAEYQKKYQSTLQDDIAAEQQAASQQQTLDAIQSLLDKAAAPVLAASAASQEDDSDDNDENNGECKKKKKKNCQTATIETIAAKVEVISNALSQLSQQPAPDEPQATVNGMPVSLNGFGNTPEYLFGIENPLFSMKDRWNQIAANPRMALSLPAVDEETDGRAFRKSARSYARSLAARYQYLVANKMTDLKALSEGQYSTSFEGVETAGVGNQFIIRRQDALIARVLKKRDLTQFFPIRYGVQDRDLLFNTFFGEVSQAYQTGEIYKGSMKIENEIGYVDDCMVKLKFGPMKDLERMYIAYLNKEGSDPIKWSMIEYCILHQLEQMQVEQNKRRVRGIYVKPEEGKAGSYLNAGTGLLYTLLRYVHDFSIKPHDDEEHSYRRYTDATMLDAVQAFCDDVVSSLSEDMDIDQHVLYLNERHKPWWIKNIRAKYGKDVDFEGPKSYLNVVPDTEIQIRWLPYLGQLSFMMMDIPGNIQFIEFVPGEMYNIKMEEQMEMVRAWSTWKEGTGAAFTGRKFLTKEALDANNYEWQQIFMNQWAATVPADATTLKATDGIWQITSANTGTTALTDITGAKEGVAYCIEIGSAENATSIAKEGKFANITKAFTPTKEGDYIMVILRSDGNFVELERRENGQRTINAALQPNVPGGR